MDIELMEYIDKKWGIYESALAEKDTLLRRHQHTMALIRTVASSLAVVLSVVIAFMLW